MGPDVRPDEYSGRCGYLRDEEGLETVEALQVPAKQVETPCSISGSKLLGQGFESQDSRKCMQLRPSENPKDRKKRRQLYWRKVAALTGTSRPPTKRTSIHPQVYKEGRFSLGLQWFHRMLDWAGEEFQPQCYPFADLHSTTKVRRPGKRARVWVNTPKSGAAVTQGLNKPWHDDTIFVICAHKLLQRVAEKAIWDLTLAFLEAQEGVEILQHPCIFGDPQTKRDKIGGRPHIRLLRSPKRGQKCYATNAFPEIPKERGKEVQGS